MGGRGNMLEGQARATPWSIFVPFVLDEGWDEAHKEERGLEGGHLDLAPPPGRVVEAGECHNGLGRVAEAAHKEEEATRR